LPEALMITRAYHRVRYGEDELRQSEIAEIEAYLRRIEEASSNIRDES